MGNIAVTSPFFISQCLAALAFVAGLVGFQCKHLKQVLICFSICSFLVSIHFALLGAWTAMVVVGLSGIRHFTAIFYRKKRALFFFLTLLVISTILTYKEPVNLLAAFASFVGTFGSFAKSTARARLLWTNATIANICHNYIIHSPVATMMEIFFLISNIIAYRRHERRKPNPI